MSEQNTDQLLTLARSGDSQAQQQLLNRHRERLKRLISTFLDPRLAARLDPSDVLQEALMCAALRLPKYLDEQPIGFYPWLRQIVREQLIVVHRRHVHADRRTIHREHPFRGGISDESAMFLADRLVSQDTSPTQRANLNELRASVRQALTDSSEANRELLLMRFVEQLKIQEISEVMSISESAVKQRLARALQKLNQIVKRHE
jgi:RNA polymerase sigma-70 factor (ECF subfamily)